MFIGMGLVCHMFIAIWVSEPYFLWIFGLANHMFIYICAGVSHMFICIWFSGPYIYRYLGWYETYVYRNVS